MRNTIKQILKEVQLSKLMKLGNDIYMSEDIDRLPKNGIIVQHRFHDKFKFNGLGIFCSEIDGTHENDYGKNKTYVYIGPSSKIITINSTEDYLIKKGLLEQDDETNELYFSDNPTERFNNDSNLYYYILQKKALNMLQQEHGKFDVLEMLFEDELTYHQYLIINNPE
jgi:hypothetical protein